MEIANITGLEKPLEKLVEVCASGVGAVARPWLLKRDAKALVEAHRILADGGLQVSSLELPSFAAQIEARVHHTEARRQSNLYQVMDHARKALPADVMDTPVNSDWTTRFFGSAQDVSDTEMQELWGRMLSGEVARPGSFSLRTLEVVRHLSRAEAQSFQALVQVSFEGAVITNEGFALEIMLPIKATTKTISLGTTAHDFASFYLERGLNLEAFLALDDAGLISRETGGEFRLHSDAPPYELTLRAGNQGLRFSGMQEPWWLAMPATRLTRVGHELSEVLREPGTLEHLRQKISSCLATTPVRCTVVEAVVDPCTGQVTGWVP